MTARRHPNSTVLLQPIFNRNTGIKVLLGGALLSMVLAGCGQKATDNTATTTAPDTTTTAPDTSMSADNTATTETASTASFMEAAATWQQIEAANANLDKIIKSKNLKTVHEAAFKVRDLVKTLPAKSKALSADKQKTLASQVGNVEQIAEMLDESGDANKLPETQENQASMNDALDSIKSLYPAGALMTIG